MVAGVPGRRQQSAAGVGAASVRLNYRCQHPPMMLEPVLPTTGLHVHATHEAPRWIFEK